MSFRNLYKYVFRSLSMGMKLPEVITEDEFKKIIAAIKSPKKRLAYCLGFYEAMRVSEVAKLRPEHINKEMKLLFIKNAKGHKDRNIPIAPEVMGGLRHLPIGNDTAKDHGIRNLQISWNRITLKVLGRRLNFHILRHSSITHYLTQKKWSSLEVQRLAGHSKVSITEIYSHIRPEHLVERMWG